MLSVLREMDIPFILSTGGAKGDVRAVCDEMIRESSANGGDEGQKWVMADWVPQADVLAHQATGWFLTHGGSNSVLEAIRLKVPLSKHYPSPLRTQFRDVSTSLSSSRLFKSLIFMASLT
jgi:UDP:flavonoid glycosyltransferase YjiC (YdhE family)